MLLLSKTSINPLYINIYIVRKLTNLPTNMPNIANQCLPSSSSYLLTHQSLLYYPLPFKLKFPN